MKLDETRTKIARMRHEAGIIRLNSLFNYDPTNKRWLVRKPKHSRPYSLRMKRKQARAARRRNR